MTMPLQNIRFDKYIRLAVVVLSAAVLGLPALPSPAQTTQQTDNQTDDTAQTAAAALTEEELEILVARIALYPDELVALVTSASLYPVQIVDAERYLEKVKIDKSLKPKEGWGASIISLLNYPEIVKMMSDDLDWTQSLGEAVTNQQKDVLAAIQQLRDEAVAKKIIKTDDKIKVEGK
jgi:Trk K+ transport system NAD-binding subunit